MNRFNVDDLSKLYMPKASSHKGDNGKLMVIGGSILFHAASLWSLKIASRIVDMVFYSSVDSNNEIVQREKEEFGDGIIVPRDKIEHYIEEADAVLIGPGLPRENGIEKGDNDTKELTETLLNKYSNKKWVVDGGSLQVIKPSTLPHNSIITPHHKEFEVLKSRIQNPELRIKIQNAKPEEQVQIFAQEFSCAVLLKGEVDIVSDGTRTVQVKGGNAGMTKGGTGDVLAGLVAALYCKNEAFLSACAGSYINKRAGEELYKKVGLYFNASDLADEIPRVMKRLLI